MPSRTARTAPDASPANKHVPLHGQGRSHSSTRSHAPSSELKSESAAHPVSAHWGCHRAGADPLSRGRPERWPVTRASDTSRPVDPFSPRLLKVEDKKATALKPVPFQGRVDELALERWIVANPSLAGEPLLILGHQLADFEEDKDRLDILALDRYGEIVLCELKVTEEFRVTDLQALAYAGAYAKRSPEDLTKTLQRHLQKAAVAAAELMVQEAAGTASSGVTGENGNAAPPVSPAPTIGFEEAASKIASFIEIDDYSAWQPSQQVRIKLIAPSFPRRVLQTVKWLGDVHSVRLEAITVRLFEVAPENYALAFERLLPLPAETDFDMTIREREDRQRAENTARRPAVLPLLIKDGKLRHGQKLWLAKAVLPADKRDLYDPDDPMFQVRVHAPGEGSPKLAWRPTADAPEQEFPPSLVPYQVYSALFPDWDREFNTPVAPNFEIAPGGKTLEDVALEAGLWEAT